MTENRNPRLPAEFGNHGTVSLGAWLGAKLFTVRLDHQVVAGVPVQVGSALAVHVVRLTSTRERELVARALQLRLQDATRGFRGPSARVPVNRAGVLAAHDLIDEVTLRLRSRDPVRPKGMARLRLLLSDGTGPLYTPRHGSVIAELRGALVAL
jgi:hypothetical protein